MMDISNDIIAARPGLRFGDVVYLTGDRFEAAEMVRQGRLTPALFKTLDTQNYFAPLNAAEMKVALQRRQADAPFPPRGIEVGLLREFGIEVPEERPVSETRIEKLAIPEGAIQVGEHFIVPEKKGIRTWYSAVNAQGELLRAKAFGNEAEARNYLIELATGNPVS